MHCVGLDRDLKTLHGIVQIKRRSGYSGSLCQKGSREYIAFYLDLGSGWDYQGTTLVEVHDVDVPKGGLWYQASPPVSPADKLLGAPGGLGNGLTTVCLEFRQPFGPVLATTVAKAFMVDNTAPQADVEITSGAGNCGKFDIGEVISGSFAMTDDHAGSLSIQVTPLPEAAGGTMVITATAPAAFLTPPFTGGNSSVSISYAGLSLNTNGASGTWELDTTGMEPCGYNVRIHVEDRTILDSGAHHWQASDIEGFCLE